jgi:rhomboid protease GluP
MENKIPDSPVSGNAQPEPIRIEPQRVRVRLPQLRPYVTYTILGLTILIFLGQMVTGELMRSGLLPACPYIFGADWFACHGMKINELIVAGQVWRLFTPMLLHAGLLHIGFNMYALYILGPELERHFGHWQFLALYVAGGFAGIVVSFLLTAAPSLGASTAIFGLLGAQAAFIYQNQGVFGPRARGALRSILNIAVINFIIGLSPGIDNWAHLGGLVGGGLVTWFGGPLYRLEGEAPDLSLANRRGEAVLFQASFGVVVLFALLAAGGAIL